jgi:hypothetical protein
MDRTSKKQLLTPRDDDLYPLVIESIAVESAGLVASGDLLVVMRVADGRRMAMRAPIAGRILRIMATVGEVFETRACVMTMREEPDLVLPGATNTLDHSSPDTPIEDAPWGIDAHAEGAIGEDWPRSDHGASHAASGAALGRIKTVKRAFAADSPQARAARNAAAPPRPKRRYPWIRHNSGDHEAEAPHSKKLWAGLAGLVFLLFLLGAIPRQFYSEAEPETESQTAQD